MKKILLLFLAISLFLFVFLKSNAWESYKTKEITRGAEYLSVRHKLHWDRFFNYIKNIPRNILESDIVKSLPIR